MILLASCQDIVIIVQIMLHGEVYVHVSYNAPGIVTGLHCRGRRV